MIKLIFSDSRSLTILYIISFSSGAKIKTLSFFFIFEKYVNDVGEDNLQNFRMLWESDRLDNDDKQVIWDWMDLFMSIARRYYNLDNFV